MKSFNRGRDADGSSEAELLGRSAYKAIRKLITENLVRPGERLAEGKLARDLGMSRAPIRDALNKLGQEGLVTLVPRKGAFVEPINPVDVANRYDVREVVEGLAARLLARKMTPGNAAILEELATKADDQSATIHDELAFHSAVVEMSGNPELPKIVQASCLHTMIYDEGSGKLAVDGDASMSVQYRISDAHRSVAAAIISGEPKKAEHAMRWHIRSGKSVVTKYLLGIDDLDGSD